MSLGEDGIIQDKSIYGTGQDESDISWMGSGLTRDGHGIQNVENELTKSFCDKDKNSWFCHFRDFFIMLAIVMIGMLILYVFITMINSVTKKHFIKSIYKIKR